MEARIDLVSFAFDLTSASIANIEDDDSRIVLEKELIELEKQINDLRYSFEMVLDFPSYHDGDMSELDDKHNNMEENISKVVQKLLALQLKCEMVDSSTARDFYMSRRHGNGNGDEE